MRIGFVGLGQMGRPIARTLLRGGVELAVHARGDRHFEELAAAGAECVADLTGLADAAVVFLCLPDATTVRETLDAALAARPVRDRVVVDLGTTSHPATLGLAHGLEARGIAFLDAPVSGMQARAADGTLTVMCGGRREVFERVRPLLDLIGSRVLHMGDTGSGQLAKLVNQLLFDINAAALAEVLPMAAKLGLDPGLMAEAIDGGTGRSWASEFFVPRILRGHFTDGYPMHDAYKDLVGAAALSAELCIPMPVLAAATATYQAALLRGHGGQDKGAMVRHFEELLDVRFRSPAGPPGDGEPGA